MMPEISTTALLDSVMTNIYRISLRWITGLNGDYETLVYIKRELQRLEKE